MCPPHIFDSASFAKVVVAESGASLSGSIISLKILGNANFLQSAQWPAAAPSRQFNLPPALSVRCWFNVVLTSSSLFIMPHAHSHHAVIEHHPRAHNIARIYEETFYIIIKNALSAPARFTPERLAGSAQSMRLFDDLA